MSNLSQSPRCSPENDETLSTAGALRYVDLAQQGYTLQEIAEALGLEQAYVERAVGEAVPGGIAVIRDRLRKRLRQWQSNQADDGWSSAEALFGIPHANITRLVRSPEADAQVDGPSEAPGYLDAVLNAADGLDERARICARGYAMGMTLQELGDRFGVTRERIRQVLKKATPWTSTQIAQVLRRLREAREAEHRAAVDDWSREHPAVSIGVGASQLGMPEAEVRRLLGRRRAHHETATGGPTDSVRRSRSEILGDLQRFHAETGATSAAAYSEWAREAEVPGHQTVSIRFGTWNDALGAAGLGVAPGNRRSRFTPIDLWAAVIAAIEGCEGRSTVRDVEGWLADHPAAPSIALIRQRLDLSWTEIADTALQVIRGGSAGMDEEWVQAVTSPRDWSATAPEVEDIQHIRDAIAEHGSSLTLNQYRRWASTQKRPTAQTLLRRTGLRWSTLVKQAGGAGTSRVRGRSRDECLAMLHRFLADYPDGVSTQYPDWARRNDAVSRSTILERFGTWRDAVDAARSV